jgi:hypothetical protein
MQLVLVQCALARADAGAHRGVAVTLVAVTKTVVKTVAAAVGIAVGSVLGLYEVCVCVCIRSI